MDRRTFLRASAAGAATAAAAGLYTWRVEPYWLDLVRRPLPVRDLPTALEGATLVQLTDIHVGPLVGDDYVRSVFARVTALQPDIVVYTGDFISNEPGILDHMAAMYDHAPHGRLATLASLGNHDYGPRWTDLQVASEVQQRLAARGIDVLRNAVRDVGGLQVMGMEDYWAHRFSTRALGRLKPSQPAIALSHNPDTVDVPGWEPFSGWILSGHTHGGQCKPPFLPPPLLPVKNRRYTSGEFALGGGRRLYIGRGVGFLIQVRFNARPEVTVFTLTAAAS